MRKVKNITVCVTPEIYRQARHLAAEYNSTVSTIVAWLLERLPAALERTRFPKGGPPPCSLAPCLSRCNPVPLGPTAYSWDKAYEFPATAFSSSVCSAACFDASGQRAAGQFPHRSGSSR